MPIYDITCPDCGYGGEVIVTGNDESLHCPSCNGNNVAKLISATSTLTGRTPRSLPGPGDTGCCGSSPDRAGCAGPGSCCGKTVT